MIKLLITIITIPLALALLYLMVMNMGGVGFDYSPVHESITLPLSVLMLSMFAIGFFFGIVITWLQSFRSNKSNNKSDKNKQKLEKSFEKQEKALIKS